MVGKCGLAVIDVGQNAYVSDFPSIGIGHCRLFTKNIQRYKNQSYKIGSEIEMKKLGQNLSLSEIFCSVVVVVVFFFLLLGVGRIRVSE